MTDCTNCKNSDWDYETFYGTSEKQWFVCGCLEDYDPETDLDEDGNCKGFEEND